MESWKTELYATDYGQSLMHYGVKGQKWDIRRYQNEDGTLTPEGRARYGVGDGISRNGKQQKILNKGYQSDLSRSLQEGYITEKQAGAMNKAYKRQDIANKSKWSHLKSAVIPAAIVAAGGVAVATLAYKTGAVSMTKYLTNANPIYDDMFLKTSDVAGKIGTIASVGSAAALGAGGIVTAVKASKQKKYRQRYGTVAKTTRENKNEQYKDRFVY